MNNLAIPDLISDMYDPGLSLSYQPDSYNIVLTHPKAVTGLNDPVHPLSDFRPENQRSIYGENGVAHQSDRLTITEDILNAFKQCYEDGSIDRMIEEQGFSPSEYLGLFFVSDLESAPHMTVTDQDEKKMSLFLEWAYENRDSFDASDISGAITGYIEDRCSVMQNMAPETISLEMMHNYMSYMSCLNSLFDKLNQLDECVRSKDRSPGYILFGSISRSVERYVVENINPMVNADLLFNTLKQKHQNRYAPHLLLDIAAFSEEWNLTERYGFRMLHILELFSSSYLKRDMNGTLDAHKSGLQEIYEDLGGNRELFPYQEPICIEMPENKKRRFKGTKYTKRHHNQNFKPPRLRKASRILDFFIKI